MNILQLKRAELFATFSEKPILYVIDLFGDGVGYWFVCNSFSEANPSNHIHYSELKNGVCINELMSTPQEFDQIMFKTKLEEIRPSSIKFHSSVKWLSIR
jgi:hypothetical protein